MSLRTGRGLFPPRYAHHVAAFAPLRKAQLKATDLQLWTLANIHIVRLGQLNIPGKPLVALHLVGKRNVSSMVRTMRQRGWIVNTWRDPRLTEEGWRVLNNSRLNPDKLVWC